MIKTLLFDNNGVITTDTEEQDLADLFCVSLEDFKVPHKEIHPEYALGKISVDEYCLRHRAAFNGQQDLEEVKKAHFNSYLLVPGVKECLVGLKDQLELAMLTNFGEAFDELNASWKLEDIFDKEKIFISGKIGFLKPDPQAFLHVVKELNRKPNEIIFIDDRQENVDAAREVGMSGIHFKTPNQFKNELKSILETEKESV